MSEPSNVERISYGLGNLGVNLLFGMTSAYLLFFYTDICRIDAALVATLFLVSRIIDAVFDPALGILIDRTNTRFGKHRPYLIALCVPYSLGGVAVFFAPDLHSWNKLVYIWITYTLFGLLYSGLSLPLNSMLPTLTRDPKTRTSINALREFLGASATLGATFITLPIVHLLGGGDQKIGFAATAGVFGLVAMAGMVLAFLKTRERVAPDRVGQLTIAQSLNATRRNWPWIATLMVNFFFWVAFIGHIQSVIYYTRDVLGRPDLTSTIMLMNLVILVGNAMVAPVANRIGKKPTAIIGGSMAALGTAALALSRDPAWIMAMTALCNVGIGLIGGLLFAFMADAVDYGEWLSGFRAQGFLFAASSFGVKAGMSVGGAAGAWLLSRAHYVAGSPVTPTVANSIMWGHIGIPALSYFAMAGSVGLMVFRPEYVPGQTHAKPVDAAQAMVAGQVGATLQA